jgi:hypothetical protein
MHPQPPEQTKTIPTLAVIINIIYVPIFLYLTAVNAISFTFTVFVSVVSKSISGPDMGVFLLPSLVLAFFVIMLDALYLRSHKPTGMPKGFTVTSIVIAGLGALGSLVFIVIGHL